MSTRARPLTSVLVKPAGPDCNMACAYCFYLPKAALFPESAVHRMSSDVLAETVRQVMAQGEQQVSFGWQGGEPVLMGVEFFREAVALQERHGRGQEVGNGLQTNGLLIDKEWAEFLSRRRFLVGLSLDGPEHVHDRYRCLRGGAGTWRRVADKAKLLLDAGTAVNALATVNDYSVRFPEETYALFKDLGLTFMQFIPIVEPDPERPGRAAPFSVPPEDFGRFLCRLFDLWLGDFKNGEPTTSVRFIDSVFHTYVGLPAPECTLLPECGSYVVVEHNGDVYSCDFFVDGEHRLGNVMETRLIDCLSSPRQRAFGRAKAALPDECRTCRWLPHCAGGCPKDRRIDRAAGGVYLCAAYKAFFEHANARLQALAREWLDRQALEIEAARAAGMGAAAAPGQAGGRARAAGGISRNDPCPCGSGLKFKRCCGKP